MNKDKNNRIGTLGERAATGFVYKADTETRDVDGVGANTEFVDSHGDLLRPVSMNNSIEKNGPKSEDNRRILHLKHHKIREDAVGSFSRLEMVGNDLEFTSKMGTHTSGDDALKQYDEKIIREHSIGFWYKDLDFVPMEKDKILAMDPRNNIDVMLMWGGYWDVKEIELIEISYVNLGSNPHTPNQTGEKTEEELNDLLIECNQRMSNLYKAIKGGYSEKYHGQFEVELCQIQQAYNSLVTTEPGKKGIKKDEPKPNNFMYHLTKQL